MSFDVESARKSGYSDSEIASFLAKQKGFDLENARKHYDDQEIVRFLSEGKETKQPQSSIKTLQQGIFGAAAEASPVVGGAILGGKFGALGGPIPAAIGAALGAGLGYASGLGPKAREVLSETTLPSGAPVTYREVKDLAPEDRPIGIAGEVIGGGAPIAAAPFLARNLQNVPKALRPIFETAQKAPKTFLATEAGGLAGAAQGGALAQLYAPDSPTARVVGEIAGGIANPVGLAARTAKGSVGQLKTALKSFTPAGREGKAAEIFQEALEAAGEDPRAIAAVLRKQGIPEVSLTSGLKSESPTLLAFETKLAQKSPEFGAFSKGKVKESLSGLRRLVSDIEATGDPELLKVAAKVRQQHFDALLTSRMRQAQAEVDRTIDAFKGNKTAASSRAYKILEDSLDDARKVERELWEKIPKNEQLAASNTVEAYNKMRAEMLPEEPLPPEFIGQFVKRISKTPFQSSATSGELLRFRSQMLSKAREARGQGKWNEARQYQDMANGALVDIEGMQLPVAKEASQWSRALNDAFTKTFAGDALAIDKTGAQRISPEAMLEKAFSGGRTTGRVRLGEIEGAAAFSGKSTLSEQEEFIRAAARSTVDPQTGKVNPRSLENFLRENAELLEKFPAAKRSLADASRAEQAFREVEESSKVASKAIKERSAFSRVLQYEDPSEAVGAAFSSKTPDKDYSSLAALARRESRGAVDGLKASTLDYATRKATDSSGRFSIHAYRRALTTPVSQRGASPVQLMQRNGVMTRDEVSRLNKILEESAKIERALTTEARIGDVMGEPDALFDLVVRIVGANVGGMSALGASSGAPIVVAGAGSRFARNLFEKVPGTRVTDVMIEASKNPAFMAKLLEKPKTVAQAKQIEKQIRSFLLQAGLLTGVEEEQPIPNRPQTENQVQMFVRG